MEKLILKSALVVVLLSFLWTMGGCQFFTDSFESAAALDQAGKKSEAIIAYQNYLKHHANSSLAAKISYRIALNYAAESDYDNALNWYQKILADYPRTDEEIHAFLDLAALYQDKLKNSSKALDYNQQAFNRYMDNIQIKDAIQYLIDAQYQTATAYFLQKKYKNVKGILDGVYKTYPVVFISPDTRARIDSLSDRTRRAEEIAKASVDLITLRSEAPFNKSFEVDFPPNTDDGEKTISSPDGNNLASRKKSPTGVYYLYVARVPAKGDQVIFKLLPQTFGADKPSWSPDGQELVYWRTQKGKRRLEKTNIKTLITQTLFYTKSNSLGMHPAYHPAGNKIAYIYEGRVSLMDTGETHYKQLLKTKQKLDYTADLAWSTDGTMIRCNETDKHGKAIEELLVLDVSASNDP